MYKLKADPTFTIKVDFPVAGKPSVPVDVTFKHRTAKELDAWRQESDQMLRLGERYTREQCETLLADDLVKHAAALDCFERPLTDGQKAAIVSFAFNVGSGAVCKSTMARKANAGYPAAEWCGELRRWTLAGGRVLPGLVKRRAAEYRLCVQ